MADKLNPACRTAGIRWIPVVNGKYKVWTKKVGSGKIKVLLVHGGPGFNHEYFECMEDFLPQEGFEMYYYDQLGCCNSDIPDDESLWTIPRYLEEVEEVRKGLGLDDFVILGHSWGGILAIEYALKYQDEGHLKAIVVSNMVASIDSFLACSARWKKTLPPDRFAMCEKIEAEGDWENPEYEKIMMEELYPKMVCRIQPWPEPLTRCIRHVNMKIYVHNFGPRPGSAIPQAPLHAAEDVLTTTCDVVQGHSEFVVTGNLKGWTSWDRLHQIKVKALMLGAENDEMDPEDMKKMAEMMPNASAAICPEGSHMAFWDSQEAYFAHLLPFLHSL